MKLRNFPEPRQTAIPFAVLLPFWAIAVLFVASRFSLDLDDVVELVLGLLLIALILVPPALGARAIYRFRTTGGL